MKPPPKFQFKLFPEFTDPTAIGGELMADNFFVFNILIEDEILDIDDLLVMYLDVDSSNENAFDYNYYSNYPLYTYTDFESSDSNFDYLNSDSNFELEEENDPADDNNPPTDPDPDPGSEDITPPEEVTNTTTTLTNSIETFSLPTSQSASTPQIISPEVTTVDSAETATVIEGAASETFESTMTDSLIDSTPVGDGILS